MKTYYEKRGRRYYPVSYYDGDVVDALPPGHYLISVTPGRMTRRSVEPATAEALAAVHAMREPMMAVMREAQRRVVDAHQYDDPERAKRAWEAWCAVMGDDVPLVCEGVSLSDVVQAGIDALTDSLSGGGEG